MNPENTKKLIEAAGPVFPENLDPRQNLMYFGFEVQDGWFKPLLEAMQQLRVLRESGIAPHVTLMQVKEKFGGLRLYTYGEDEHDIVNCVTSYAERRCGHMCEECGEYGRLRTGGWHLTLCDKHAEERGYDKDGDKEEED